MQSVVVTGAASGIGAAVVEALLSHDFHVHATDRNFESLETAAEGWAGQFSLYQCDVADERSVQALFATIEAHESELFGLVNAAGIREIEFPLDLATSDWSKVIGVNLTGTFMMCREAALHMVRGGSIVNISSSAGLFGITHRAAYSSSKHAVIGLTKTLAQDLGSTRAIRVNAICPGSITTPLTVAYTEDESFLEGLKHTVPLARPGTAAEVADLIAFLLSPQSAYVSGAVIPIDGGWSATKSFAMGNNSAFTAKSDISDKAAAHEV